METLLPRLALTGEGPVERETLFPGASAMHLEIGFGGGEHLADHATRRPDLGFIGCEPFQNGVAKFLEQVDARSLQNVRIHVGDAGLLLGRLPNGSIGGIDILYADPWPKRRQRKRRFISDDILRRLARVTAAGAALRFATDIDDYAGWTLARMLRSRTWVWTATHADDWRQPWPDWPSTRYEAKALREGRQPVYLTFIRRPGPA